jgi:hypothetical protein
MEPETQKAIDLCERLGKDAIGEDFNTVISAAMGLMVSAALGRNLSLEDLLFIVSDHYLHSSGESHKAEKVVN